jgi:hypothetical protein
MAFTADLNPKGGKSMDLLEMVKMEDYLERRKALSSAGKSSAKTATPAADAILAKPIPNNMLKSSADDIGTEFRFNSKQHANDNMA